MSEKLFYLDLKQSFINQEIKVLDIVGINHYVVNINHYVVNINHNVVNINHNVVNINHYVVNINHYVVNINHYVVNIVTRKPKIQISYIIVKITR